MTDEDRIAYLAKLDTISTHNKLRRANEAEFDAI